MWQHYKNLTNLQRLMSGPKRYFKSQEMIYIEKYINSRKQLLLSKHVIELPEFLNQKKLENINDLELLYFEYLIKFLQKECSTVNYSIENLIHDFKIYRFNLYDNENTVAHIEKQLQYLSMEKGSNNENVIVDFCMKPIDKVTIVDLELIPYLTNKYLRFSFFEITKLFYKNKNTIICKNYQNVRTSIIYNKIISTKNSNVTTASLVRIYNYFIKEDARINNRRNRYKVNNKAPWLVKQNKKKNQLVKILSNVIYYLLWKPLMPFVWLILFFGHKSKKK